METTLTATAQRCTFGYPTAPMFETGARKGWQRGTVVESKRGKYTTRSAAQGQATRFLNAWADGRTVTDRYTDEHGFSVTILRSDAAWDYGRYSYVMIRTRITD